MNNHISYLDSVKHHSVLYREWQESKDLYDRINWLIEGKTFFLDFLKKYIIYLSGKKKNRLKVLEEGCGTATNSCVLKKEFPHIDSYAVDLSTEAIKLAGKIKDIIKVPLVLKVDDAVSTKFASGYFDMIFSQGLIEHFYRPADIFLEQHRILEKGGLLIMSVPQKYSLFTIFKKVKMRFGKWPHGWEREYTARDLTNVGVMAGFRIIEIDGYGFTIEDFVRARIRRINNKFSNKYLLRPVFYIVTNIFFLIRVLLGKALRKRVCKYLVAVFEK